MSTIHRVQEIARAIQAGGARDVELRELAEWVLALRPPMSPEQAEQLTRDWNEAAKEFLEADPWGDKKLLADLDRATSERDEAVRLLHMLDRPDASHPDVAAFLDRVEWGEAPPITRDRVISTAGGPPWTIEGDPAAGKWRAVGPWRDERAVVEAEVLSALAGGKAECRIGHFCGRHDFVHGAEAEELRDRIEAIVEDLLPDTFPRTCGWSAAYDACRDVHDKLLDVLNRVDARDSVAFLETRETERVKK